MSMDPTAAGPDNDGDSPDRTPPDWEAFYRDYRKPGYIEGFEITSKLGGGMFGMVFRARRMSIGKDYAIKFLKVDDGEVRNAVLSELEQVKYFAQIDHPNLVSIEDRGEVHGIPFLVMAFAGTETLRDKMTAVGLEEGQRLSPADKDELLRAFLQSARGLQALHARSLVHFDIKPANVFMKGGVARLGDYGLSKLVTHSRGSLSMGRGTPYYMAPEMLKRRGDVRSDIYSLGVMLYEILCGKVPFTGDSEWEVLRQHENTPPELPTHLTPIERAVLQRCLAKQPEERFESVDELVAMLESGVPAQVAPMTAGSAAASAATAPPLPTCVPPPLPLSARVTNKRPPAPPLSRRAGRAVGQVKRRSGINFGFLGLFAAVLTVTFVMLAMIRGSDSPARGFARTVSMETVPMRAPRNLLEAAEQHAAKVLVDARRDAQRNRPRKLRALNVKKLDVPTDFPAYREMVGPVAESPRFVPALAKRAQALGRPALIAAVAMLQELDYENGLDCRKAVNLQQLLAQMTGIDKMVLQISGRHPSARETCMFHAVAGGWRVFAERYARSDEVFLELGGGAYQVAPFEVVRRK